MARRHAARILHCIDCCASVVEPSDLVIDDDHPYVAFIETHEGPEHRLSGKTQLPDGWAILDGGATEPPPPAPVDAANDPSPRCAPRAAFGGEAA